MSAANCTAPNVAVQFAALIAPYANRYDGLWAIRAR